MKKDNFSFSKAMFIAVAAIGLSAFISSCTKGLDNGRNDNPAAGLMVLNLAPDQNAVGVALSGGLVTNMPLGFTSFNGTYQSVYTGQREIAVYDYSTDSVIIKSNFEFQDKEKYSLFVTGNKGVYSTVVVKDEVDSTASAEKAYLRFINAVPDSADPVVTITAGDNKVFDAASAFNTVSAFSAVNEGDVTVSISGVNINASRTISLQKGGVYTALVIGDPAKTDTTSKIQIRYIQNGVVPVSTNK